MNSTKNAVIITIFSSMCQGKNHYTKTSINKIGKNLEKYHKIHVKRRWIFYCVRELLDSDLITRQARYKNNSGGEIRQITSMISFTLKGLKYLVSKRVTGAWKLLKAMMEYALSKDKRWPKKADIKIPKKAERYVPSKAEWSKLLGIVGRKVDG